MGDGRIRIRFEVGETGWAEPVGDGKARIRNLPLTDRLNCRDVVKLEDDTPEGEEPGSFFRAGPVVMRELPQKFGIRYPEPHQQSWDRIRAVLGGGRGYPCESLTAGMAMVAVPAWISMRELRETIGIEGLTLEPLLLHPVGTRPFERPGRSG